MGEFTRNADRISRVIEETSGNGGIKVKDIPDIIGSIFGHDINCYPGIPGAICHRQAVFLSLKSKRYIGGHRGHLSFRKAIEMIVQHVQGICLGQTHEVIFIADSWDPDAFDEWRAALKVIQNNVHMEVYLLAGGVVSEIIF